MKTISNFDILVSKKVYKKCVDAGYTKYSEIAIIMNTSDSFTKAVFSSYRKKLNLYHLMRLKYELHCSLNDFIPNKDEYKEIFENTTDEFDCFLKSIEEDKDE